MEIVDFGSLCPARHAEAATILRDALAHLPSAYNAPGEAEAEVALRSVDGDWLGYAALDGERLAGWVGAIRTYSHGWEIHPLVVAPDCQRRGIGSTLMAALEARARGEGVLTLFLGSDDDYGGTTLFGRDLWPDVATPRHGDRGDGARACPHLLSPARLQDRRAAARRERRRPAGHPAGQAAR